MSSSAMSGSNRSISSRTGANKGYMSAGGASIHMAYEYCKSPSGRILLLRILVTFSLLAAAAICGSVNYILMSRSEKRFAISQYESISSQALIVMLGSFSRMNDGAATFAKSYGYAFPNETYWPFVNINGFYDTATTLARVSSVDSLIFAPMFRQDKRDEFVTFMNSYFASEPAIDMTGTPYQLVGNQIYSINPFTPTYIYPDMDGAVTLYPTPNQNLYSVTLQITFSEDVTPAQLAFNSHPDPLFGPSIDFILACVNNSADYQAALNNCAFFSNTVTLPVPNPMNPTPTTTNMQAFIFRPIVLERVTPEGSTGVVVGTVAGAINWKILLSKAVPTYVNGLDCVVSTSTTTTNEKRYFTYAMVDGEPVFQGESDLHDPEYSEYARSVDLLQDAAVTSFVSYELTFYPRRSYFRVYQTNAPLMTTIGAVVIILFCCLVFFIYDVSISRESSRKELVLETKRRFVRFISHEIRTPMNTVRLGLKLLGMEMEAVFNQLDMTPADQLVPLLVESFTNWIQLTDDILGNGDSAVDVLNDLLNYDKIESGTLRLEFSCVAIWTLVKKTAAAFVMQAKQKNIDLQLIGDCWSADLTDEQADVYDNLRVVGDVTRIAQVLRNLLSNALKFTPETGRVILQVEWIEHALPEAFIVVPEDQIELLEEPRAGAISISVTDSGAGLSPDQLAQICTEGMQFNANQLQAGQGSGLGLYISKGLAEQHGGSLAVDSKGLGKGATFTFMLPLFMFQQPAMLHLSRTKPNGLSSRHSSRQSSRKSSASSKVVPMDFAGASDPSMAKLLNADDLEAQVERPARVMIVDDATSNRKLLMRILKAKGYVCDGAEDGQQAVDQYILLRSQGETVDAILMDFEMPVMDGPTATKRLRELGCNSFIVGVTGNVMVRDVDHFRAHGANAVLAKPLNVDVFESMHKVFHVSPDDTPNALIKAMAKLKAQAEENAAPLQVQSIET